MLRPVRSVPRPAAAATAGVAALRKGATLGEAAKDGPDVGKNAFLLAHGYVTWDVKHLWWLMNFLVPSVLGIAFPRKCMNM